MRAARMEAGRRASSLNIIDGTFANNAVTGNSSAAGALYAFNSDIVVTGASFENNTASGSNHAAGALYAYDSDVDITDASFENNAALGISGIGGAITYTGVSPITVASSLFEGNFGGAIYTFNNAGDTLFIADSQFTGNSSNDASRGAALHVQGSTTIQNSVFTNQANGPAIQHAPNGAITVTAVTVMKRHGRWNPPRRHSASASEPTGRTRVRSSTPCCGVSMSAGSPPS